MINDFQRASVQLFTLDMFFAIYIHGPLSSIAVWADGGGVAQWLGRRISYQGVPGSNPGWCTFRCGVERVTFSLLSTG